MKIAIPVNQGEVNQHFGRSEAFAVIEAENGEVTGVEEFSAAGLQHDHGGLANFLAKQDVKVVIVGGIGQGALEALEAYGFEVVFGAKGPVTGVVKQYLAGNMSSRRVVCNHDHGHHHQHHGHTCGHNQEGHNCHGHKD